MQIQTHIENYISALEQKCRNHKVRAGFNKFWEYVGITESFAKVILPDISGKLWHFPNLYQCLTTLHAKFGVIWTKIVGTTHSERALTETWNFDQISLQRIGVFLEMAKKPPFSIDNQSKTYLRCYGRFGMNHLTLLAHWFSQEN